MEDAPYPGLDPDLWQIVRDMGPNPPPDIPLAELRALARQEDRHTPAVPANMRVLDAAIPCRDNKVPIRQFIPPNARGAMIYLHGGGWVLGLATIHDQIATDLASGTGLCVVSVDYSLAPEHPYPAALDECVAVFDQLERDFEGPLWVAGDSAGANLALGLAMRRAHSGSRQPDGLLLFYPAIDPSCSAPSHVDHANAPGLDTASMRRFWRDYLGEGAPDRFSAPGPKDAADIPPSVIMTAGLDPLVGEGDELARALVREGNECWHHRADGLIHGFLRHRHIAPAAEAAFLLAVKAVRDRLA